jgi:hypothetical protein
MGVPIKRADVTVVHDEYNNWRTNFKRARIRAEDWARLSSRHSKESFDYWRTTGSLIMQALADLWLGMLLMAYGSWCKLYLEYLQAKKQEQARKHAQQDEACQDRFIGHYGSGFSRSK